ncbi:hypothetical protein ACC691_39935, partial [Rhizobium johnstonii]|uniref:hypothetical protein n=1 Tax=Rhizobium johnstonii TaxID=3019933 RepID=UPI003F9DD878
DTYEAKSVNDVGMSTTSVTTDAWAYDPPSMGQPTSTQAFVSGTTSPSTGVVDVKIPSAEPAAAKYTITSGQTALGTYDRTGSSTT